MSCRKPASFLVRGIWLSDSSKNYWKRTFDSIFLLFIQASYDVELHALHELIQSKVVALLTNSDNIVKRTLMENGVTRLCVFFGRQKANDVLLSHIITFLNDKQDWQLRAAFFDSIVGVAVYIGWHCLSIVKPLLQQVLFYYAFIYICVCIVVRNFLFFKGGFTPLKKPEKGRMIFFVLIWGC